MKTICSCLAVLFLSLTPQSSEAALRAGAHTADATPMELPVLVNGGMRQREVSEVGSRITARAIVLDDGKTQLAMVVVDSCMLQRDMLNDVKATVKKRPGIPASKQFICVTHTHSAPASMGCLGTSVDPRYPLLLKR